VMTKAATDILLIDEVLAVGDAAFQQKCFDVFHRMRDAGRTILFVTHDMTSVTRFCHRALLLDRGAVMTVDEPAEVARRYLELNFPAGEGAPAPGASGGGEGGAEILDAWTEEEGGDRRTTFLSGETCVFRARVRFEDDVADPNVNIVWVNERGDSVFAVSTANDSNGTGRFAAGESALVTVAFPACFAPGRVWVSMIVARPENPHVFMDHRPQLLSMLVANPNAGGGLVDLPHERSVEPDAVASLQRETA
jgi:Wzt C-terminal domain